MTSAVGSAENILQRKPKRTGWADAKNARPHFAATRPLDRVLCDCCQDETTGFSKRRPVGYRRIVPGRITEGGIRIAPEKAGNGESLHGAEIGGME